MDHNNKETVPTDTSKESSSIGQNDNVENVEASHYDEKRVVDLSHKDKAAIFLQNQERLEVTPEENKRILKRIDLRLLPILLVVYFLQQLDKSVLSYSSVFGLIEDAKLVGQEYSWLGSVIYIAQLVMQPLIAVLLVKFPIGKFLAIMVLCWGTILCCMAAAHNFIGLLITRLFLGMFEASVAPTFVAITTMWWRRGEQTNRNAAWYAMNGVTNILGSLLGYGLGHIDSPVLFSYQIIFLFAGLLTVVTAFVVFFFLPDSPMEAKFLNDHDKVLSLERLRENQMGVKSTEWRWDQVMESLLDLKTWGWFCIIFAISIPSGGITTFGPLIIRSLGFDKYTAILLNMPFGAIQIIATIGSAAFATWTKKKGPALALLCIPPIIGTLMLLILPHNAGNRGAQLAGYYFISFYPGISPLIYSWSAQNTAGETKKKTTTAMLFIGQSAGNIIGPHLYTQKDAPRYRRGLTSSLVLFILIIILVVIITVYLMFLNKQHAKRRVAMGKSAIIIDRSMMTDQERAADTAAIGSNEEGTINASGEHSFEDMTDLKNEDFIFVY